MSKLIHYITESRAKSIDDDKARSLLENECSDAHAAFNKGKKLFRGYYQSESSLLFIDPKQGKPRESAYAGSNYYTLLMDNLPSWKKYPKRSQGIIMSSSFQKAAQYTYNIDNVYIVFPYNKSKLAVAPEDDIFFSFNIFNEFNMIMGNGRTFNEFIDKLMNITGYKRGDKSWTMLKKGLQDFDSDTAIEEYGAVYGKYETKEFKEFMQKYYKGDLLKTLDTVLDPQKNKFRLTTDINKIPADREVWTSDKCLMVKIDEYDALINKDDEEFTSKMEQMFDLEETDDSIDYIEGVPCEEILYMEDDMYESYHISLQKHYDQHRHLPTTQTVWKLDSDSRETNRGQYKYFALGKQGMLATIRAGLLKKNTVDIEIEGFGYNPYSTFGIHWKFKPNMEWKNLEIFADPEYLQEDLDKLEDAGLI